MVVKLVRRRVFPTLFVTSILGSVQYTKDSELKKTYAIPLFIEHKGGDGPSGVRAVTDLTPNTNSGAAPAVLVLSSRNGTSRHRHDRVSGGSVEEEITEVVDGGNDQPMVFLISLPG